MKRWTVLAIVFCAACCASLAAFAQDPVPFKEHAQFRDAVIDDGAGRAYVAAYERNQILVVDLATGATASVVNVGRGPVALAREGWALACVNRLDNTVSIVRLPEMSVSNTVTVGAGPAAVVAVAGKFVVANSFADSLSVIDPGTGAVVEMLGVPAVPTLLAASGKYIAVAGKADPSVRIIEMGGSSKTVSLDAVPAGMTDLPDGRFAVGTGSGLRLVDPAKGAVEPVSNYQVGPMDIQRLAARIASPVLLDLPGLPPHEGLLTDDQHKGATRFVRGDGRLLALYAGTRSAVIYPRRGAEPLPVVAAVAPVAEAPAPAVEPAPVAEDKMIVEAQPIEEAAPTPAPAPEPAEEKSIPAPVEAPQASDAPPAPAPQPVMSAAKPAEAPAAPAGSVLSSMRENPIRTSGVRAPKPGRAPGVNPLERVSRRKFEETLAQPTTFGNIQQGFEPPDYKDPLRDVQADSMTQELDSDRTNLEGNVRLKMGDMDFSSDAFTYSQQEGDFHATGNVRMAQLESTLEAGELQYIIPPKDDAKLEVSPDIFRPAGDAESLDDRRLRQGRLIAKDLHVEEPSRAIRAETVDYDFATGTGELTNAKGRADMWYFHAQKLRVLGPASASGEDVWVTTCDHDPPHYRIKLKNFETGEDGRMKAKSAQLRLGPVGTPFFLPRWSNGVGGKDWSMDFDTGHRAELGFYANVGQRYEVSPQVGLGPRVFATAKDGIGLGADMDYDFTGKPASRLYMNQGEFHALYTTQERGYVHWYNRWDANDDLTVRLQVEQWGDQDFYKDYFYHEYRDRTAPRTFGAVTYRQPTYIAEGVVQTNTHSWERQTERLPEVAFHLLERPVFDRFYLTFDTVNGYNDRQPAGGAGIRTVNTARLSYDLDLGTYLNIMPYLELQDAWYSDRRFDDESGNRFSPSAGVNFQTRLQRTYGGAMGFSGFKHIVVPSLTYLYRPGSSLDIEDTPRFDALDNAFGLSRIETKLDNVLYGKDAESGQIWQVARLSLYQGNDLWNEVSKAEDYEVELDVRPRPWWGYQLVGERHSVDGDFDLTSPDSWRQATLQRYERVFNQPFDPQRDRDFDVRFGDYNRVLTQLYYDNTPQGGRWTSRVGFAYTATQGNTYNREMLYGLGVRLGDNWALAFEHRYDFEDDGLRSQTYEIRRKLHCWEAGLLFRDREQGFDVDLTFNITAFPGSKLKL